MNLFKLLKIIGPLMLWLAVFPTYAYAYLDPATGSYVLQVLLGLVFGAAFALKMFWGNVKTFISTIFSRSKKD